MNRSYYLILFFNLFVLFGSSQNNDYVLSDDSLVNYHASINRIYYATRTKTKPKIDGILNDTCWESFGFWQGGFIQQQPKQAKPASQETEIKILFDDDYLYVAIIAHDNKPEKMRPVLGRRDENNGDVVGIAFDSYFDKQTAFEFNVTAAGQKIDLMHLGEYGWDFNWDAVWDGKSSVGDSAWYAEMRIPFSQLRYAKKEEHIWGMHIWRWIDRLKEEDQWKLIPIDAPAMVYIFGELHGINNISSKRNFELLPYAKTKYISNVTDSWNYGFGLDGKIGVTSNFTLDYTINPDFGQVEADPSVLNLTSYEVFYNEKRPFFLEGNNILDYGLEGDLLFYSRRIGEAPNIDMILNNDESSSLIGHTSILNAVKLTGKSRSGFSLGVINSMTSSEEATIYSGESNRKTEVEPFTNYFIGRAKQDFNNGNTFFGGMLASTIRNIKNENLSFLPDNSFVGGLDFQHNWLNRKYFVDLKSFFSQINGDTTAIKLLQRSPVHLFQRTDAEHLSVYPEKTSLNGWGGELSGGKRSGKLRLTGKLSWRSPGVDLNDVGYLRQADFIEEKIDFLYRVNEPKGILNSYYVNLEHSHLWSYGGESLEDQLNSHARVQFKNLWRTDIVLNRKFKEIDTRQLRGGPSLYIGGNTSGELFVQTNTSKDLFFGVGLELTKYDDKISKSKDYTFHAQWLVNKRLSITSRTTYIGEIYNHQYVLIDDEQEYVVGKIDRHTIYTTLRAELFVTPEISFQFYGSPYASSGKYTDFRKVAEADSRIPDERYSTLIVRDVSHDIGKVMIDEDGHVIYNFSNGNPDFNFQEFRSNFVARWEYKTGSTIYFVWTNNLSRYQNGYVPSLLKSFKGLSDAFVQNAFMIKISYWFSL